MDTDTLIKERQSLAEKKRKIHLREKIIKERERKALYRKFLHVGKIAHQAGITNLDLDSIRGAFLEIADFSQDPNKLENWKALASSISKSISTEGREQLAICFDESPDPKVKRTLRDLEFKWNAFRKEFYGYGKKQDLQRQLKDVKCRIEVLDE